MLQSKRSPLSSVCVVLLFSALSPLCPALGQSARPAAATAVSQMSGAAGAEVSATVSRLGSVSFISTVPGAAIPLDQRGTAEERARAFLGSYGPAFGLGQGVGTETARVSPLDEVGMEHVRFRQTYQGVPVTGGELTVHLRGRSVVAVNAKTVPNLEGVATVPTVTAPEARILAHEALERDLGVTGAALSAPRLELLNKGLLGGRGSATTLAWFIEARKIDLREYLWIDARAGKVVLRFSQLTDARDRQVYDADDPGDGVYGDLPGSLVRSEGGAPVTGSAATDANAAYDYSGDTYDYFNDHHGRDSYDGAGATLISTVRFCPNAETCPFANAFWNGVQMVYGEGWPAADDVDAHELTHALTEHTANLFYYMQSGALNESYSDIFGETVDLLNGAGTDTAGVRWEIGEDVPDFGTFRDMADPTVFGHPGKMSDDEFRCNDSFFFDRGGVHSNSGVPNKAYYLMVDGDSYNGQTVSGIGLTKAGKVQYRVLSQYLLSASNFLDNYNALNQACQDLVGTAGITTDDCTQVAKALDAVEMDDTWPCQPTQAAVPAYCPVGQGPSLSYYEDFESGIADIPSCPSDDVSSDWCVNERSSLLGSFATSGDQSLWGRNLPSAGLIFQDFRFRDMPPADSRLQFNHAYGFRNDGSSYDDGGQVVYTTDGGSTWVSDGHLISAGQSYEGTITDFDFGNNPLAGEAAFVAESWGYTATQLDLSTLSGSAFGFGFRIGTDHFGEDVGWFVDDVRIYTCPTCLENRVLDDAYTGMAPHYKASSSITAGDGFTVQPGEDVTFEVGGSVALTDGFSALGDFTVITGSDACSSPRLP